ncbi:hypothetical protein ACJX0J_028684, partial [Zea mays]
MIKLEYQIILHYYLAQWLHVPLNNNKLGTDSSEKDIHFFFQFWQCYKHNQQLLVIKGEKETTCSAHEAAHGGSGRIDAGTIFHKEQILYIATFCHYKKIDWLNLYLPAFLRDPIELMFFLQIAAQNVYLHISHNSQRRAQALKHSRVHQKQEYLAGVHAA